MFTSFLIISEERNQKERRREVKKRVEMGNFSLQLDSKLCHITFFMIFIYDDRYTKKDRRAVDLDKAGRNISERICFFTKKF